MTLTVPNKSSNCGASPKSVNTDLMFRSVFLKNDVAFLPMVQSGDYNGDIANELQAAIDDFKANHTW
jgi:hypothetical protein